MMTGLPIAILLAAQSAAAASAPAGPQAAASASSAKPCQAEFPKGDEQEIVICVERPQSYRIDPDVLDAQRQAKRKPLKRPERLNDNKCASVGPMGCGGGGIDVLSAAVAAATMIKRAVKGENVGAMFITQPEPDEYQLYLEVKREREAKRAAEKAKAEAAAEAATTDDE